jgi:hypothetical protein
MNMRKIDMIRNTLELILIIILFFSYKADQANKRAEIMRTFKSILSDTYHIQSLQYQKLGMFEDAYVCLEIAMTTELYSGSTGLEKLNRFNDEIEELKKTRGVKVDE